MPRLKIAIADDEGDLRDYLRLVLTRLGHEVLVAEDGQRLVEVCLAEPPDVVITDQRMPGLDGLSAAAEINRSRRVPVILLSATTDAQVLSPPPDDFLTGRLSKPVKVRELQEALAVACPSPLP